MSCDSKLSTAESTCHPASHFKNLLQKFDKLKGCETSVPCRKTRQQISPCQTTVADCTQLSHVDRNLTDMKGSGLCIGDGIHTLRPICTEEKGRDGRNVTKLEHLFPSHQQVAVCSKDSYITQQKECTEMVVDSSSHERVDVEAGGRSSSLSQSASCVEITCYCGSQTSTVADAVGHNVDVRAKCRRVQRQTSVRTQSHTDISCQHQLTDSSPQSLAAVTDGVSHSCDVTIADGQPQPP
jgi:hypothetical protein